MINTLHQDRQGLDRELSLLVQIEVPFLLIQNIISQLTERQSRFLVSVVEQGRHLKAPSWFPQVPKLYSVKTLGDVGERGEVKR